MAFDITKLDFILPNNWELVRLGDIADINSNTISKKDKFKTIKYIDISSVSTHSMELPKEILFDQSPSRARRKLKNNDFIISTVRPNLRQFVFLETVEPNWIASTGFCVVSAKNSKHSWYLYSLVTSETFTEYLSRVANGGAYPAFNAIEIEDAIIPLPNDDDLELINSFAKNINNKIQLNTQTNQTLEAIAQAIFKSWFVDFDPVRAKAAALSEGKSEHEANLAAMSVICGKDTSELNDTEYKALWQIAEAFPSELVANEQFGEVPKGWELTTFGEVSECFDRKRIPLSKKQREEKKGTIPYYGATSIMDYVDEAIFDDIYLLVGEDGSVLREDGTPFIQYIWGKSWVNNHAHVLQGKNGISTEHLMTFIRTENISAYVTGAVQMKLNQANMNRIPFLKANNKINIVFDCFLKSIYLKFRNNIEENQILAQTRDLLLPKLLSGEIHL